jgi:predicted ArsR family transcriptional regulator
LYLALKLAEFGQMVGAAVTGALGGVDISDNPSLLIVVRLELDGPMRPGDIAGTVGLTSGGVTKVLTRLENAGLVTRRRRAFAHDRRGVEVSLTDEGRKAARLFGIELERQLAQSPDLVRDMYRLLPVTPDLT